MKFKRIYMEGAYSFPILDFDFTEQSGGVTIILGKNLDQKTNNGAGKSTILKTLFLLLYGKDLNGAAIDDAISWNSVGGFSGFLDFEDRGHQFRITRYRKAVPREDGVKLYNGTPVSGSGIEFLMDGMPLNGDTHPKTQEIIENKIRVSQRLFLSSVLMAQNSRDNFLLANDSEKKELLTELLDLREYAIAFDSVKKEIKLTEEKLGLIEVKIETLNESIQANKNKIEQFKDEELKWIEDNKETIKNLKIELEKEKEALTKTRGMLKTSKNPEKALSLKKEIEEIDELLKKIDEKIQKENKYNLAKTELQGKISTAESHIKSNTEAKTKLEEERVDLEESINEKLEIKDLSKEEDQAKKLKEDILNIEKDLTSSEVLSSQLESLSANIEKQKENLKKQEKELEETLKDSKCPTCLKGFEDGDVHFDEIKNKFEKEINSIKKDLSDSETKSSSIEKNIKLSLEKETKLKELKDKEKEIVEFIQKYSLENEKNKVLIDQLDKNKKRLVSIKEDLNKKEESLKKLEDFIKNKKEKIAILDDLIKKLDPIKKEKEKQNLERQKKQEELETHNKALSLFENLKQQEKDQEERIISLEKRIKEYSVKENPYKKIKTSLSEEIENIKNNLKERREVASKIQEELKYLQFWKQGFAPTGIRSFITDDIMDVLNLKTQENLLDLFDGALTVLFEPETSGKKGVSSNKISTKFFLNGNEAKKEQLSGGELQRAILAVDLALTEIAESRSGIKLNIKFLDEPFTGIDAAGQMKSLALFSRLAKNKDGFYIISHEEKFQNLCQNAIYILKKNSVSKFATKEEFDSISFTDDEADAFFLKQEEAVKNKPGRGRPKKIKKISSLHKDEE